MFHFLASIFAKFGSAGIIILSTLGLAHSPIVPAPQPVDAVPALIAETPRKVIVEEPKKIASSISVAPKVGKTNTFSVVTPVSAIKTYKTPSGAIIDANGNILNQDDLDALKIQLQKLIGTVTVVQSPATIPVPISAQVTIANSPVLAPAPTPVPAPRVFDRMSVEIRRLYPLCTGVGPYFSENYFLEKDKEYFFNVKVFDQYGQAFNDRMIEMRDKNSQVLDSKSTIYADNYADRCAPFSYTPNMDTKSKLETLTFYSVSDGQSKSISFNTSFADPKIELIEPLSAETIKWSEVNSWDPHPTLLKARILTEGETIGIDYIEGEVIADGLPPEGVRTFVYINHTQVGLGNIKSGTIGFALERIKIGSGDILSLFTDSGITANITIKITKIRGMSFSSGLDRSLAGLPITIPTVTLSE